MHRLRIMSDFMMARACDVGAGIRCFFGSVERLNAPAASARTER